MDKFLRICNYIVTVIMVILTGYLFLISIFNTSMIVFYDAINRAAPNERTVYLTDSPMFHLTAIVLIFLLGYLIVSHFHIPSEQTINKILVAVHIVIAFVLFAAVVAYVYYPVWDQENVVNAAYNLINNDYSFWQRGGYNYAYPWLNSLTLFLVPLIYIFGVPGSFIAFRIFNLGMFILASYSLYGFCKETKFKSAVTSLAFVLYFPASLYIFYIYGNIACLSLSMFAVWMAVRYLNHKQKKDIIFCAVAISVAALFKDYALITLVAILIVIGLCSLTSRCWKQFLWIPVFIIMYWGFGLIVDTAIESITGEDVPSGVDIYGHLAMGISEGDHANGWYNDFDSDLLAACDYDLDLYRSVSKTLYQQKAEVFWNDSSYAADFLVKKTVSQWNNPTFESIWILEVMLLNTKYKNKEYIPNSLWIDGSVTNMIYYYIFNLVQSMILFGSLYYFVFESRKTVLPSMIPEITFIGGFLFLFFWEAKAQYTLLFFVMLFPYGVMGFVSLFRSLKKLFNSTNKKEWYRSGTVIFCGLLLGIILVLTIIDVQPLNKIFKLGTDDEYFTECYEESIDFFSGLYEMN